MRKILLLGLGLTLVLCFPGEMYGHRGKRNSFGCHKNERRRNYHCHRGPLEGRTFSSLAKAKAALQVQRARSEPIVITNEALLVYYRPNRWAARGLTPGVKLDGREIARLDNGRYFSILVEPGIHQSRSSMKRHAPVEVNAKAGDVIYFEMVLLPGTWKSGGRLIPTPAADALDAIRKLKPLGHKWVSDVRVGFSIVATYEPGEAAPETPASESAEASAYVSVVEVDSRPSNADIFLDGKFVGNTPMTLRLKEGEYTIRIEKGAHTPWEKTLTALPMNTLRVFAELQVETPK